MDIAKLSIAVDSSSVKQATRDMGEMQAKGENLMRILAGLGTALGVGAIVQQFVATNQEFQRLSASLVTVTGDIDSAQRAFAMVQDFAKTTPYELTELTQAFVDLKTRGMDASVSSLTSYGNMASAFGRSLTDLIRAVSGVAMGESEAIKSFGVQARTEGDRIALTFKGQTEIINRSASAVEDYFKRLSDANFASGMERQAKTLGGVLSNLKDQVASTFFAIGNAGASDVMTKSILGLTNAIARATPTLVEFTTKSIQGFSSLIGIIQSYKMQIGLAVVVLGTMSAATALVNSTTLASVVAFSAQTARVVALTYAASGFSVSAAAAAIAQASWNAATLTGVAAAGVLAAAIAALYIATKSMREEIERLNKEVENNKPWHDRAALHKNFAADTNQVLENVKLLRAALAGDKGAKDELAMPEVSAYKRLAAEMGTEAFDRQVKMRVDAVKTERELKSQLDAQNKAMKDGEEAAKKLHAERKKFFADQAEAYAKATLSESKLLDMEMKRLRLKGSDRAMQNILQGVVDTATMKPLDEGLRDIPDLKPATVNALDLQMAMIKAQREARNLRLAVVTNWDIISQVIEDSSQNATDALVSWMNNLDGVGRSWDTLGQTVKRVIADMLIQMQRMIIQQQVMSPLMQWATNPSTWAGLFGGSGTTATTGGTAGGGLNLGEASIQSGARVGPTINISINSNGTTDTKATGEGAAELGRMVNAVCDQWAVKNMRAGGLLARA